MRTFLPFSFNQMDNVSEIVWNLPVTPLHTRAPKYDNLRVIISQREDTVDLVQIRPLKHLARRFFQNRKKIPVDSSIPLKYVKEKNQLKNDAYELIPWFKDKKDAIPIEYLDHYQLLVNKDEERIRATTHNQRSTISLDTKLSTRKSYSLSTTSTRNSYLPPNISDLASASEYSSSEVRSYISHE